ncbi:MAG: hypothetical protein RIQ54_416 [Candidatus Parcubacteria bacterium]|jgi:hypothetical protein
MTIFNTKEVSVSIEESVRSLRRDFHKTLVSLSSGAILLTFTIIQILPRDFSWKFALQFSWVCFAVVIMLDFASYLFQLNRIVYFLAGARYLERTEDERDQQSGLSLIDSSIRFLAIDIWLEIVELSVFLLALIGLLVFVMKNF